MSPVQKQHHVLTQKCNRVSTFFNEMDDLCYIFMLPEVEFPITSCQDAKSAAALPPDTKVLLLNSRSVASEKQIVNSSKVCTTARSMTKHKYEQYDIIPGLGKITAGTETLPDSASSYADDNVLLGLVPQKLENGNKSCNITLHSRKNHGTMILEYLLFKQPVAAPLKVFIIFAMSIVTVQHINTSDLNKSKAA
ncbi:basic-leucine zipper transcription factor family protein [Striga asiatica]|uniref:Basic-leucine zipper transcription factor family protein n=1 Tax=Striga asiatica TaxID=4170 RepID=A0A5A7RCW3_STRAF|nr:basic-leucine zipper transcription factor family protein [Striga asiatica]